MSTTRERQKTENHVEPRQIALRTEDAGDPSHHHTAVFNKDGNGYTSEAADGHRHRVRELEVQPAGGHTHELSDHREEIPAYAMGAELQAAPRARRHKQVA